MYKRTEWLDKVVDAQTGVLVQKGTEKSAANFNNIENGIADAHIATALTMIAGHHNSIIAKTSTIELLASKWKGTDSVYSQTVTLSGITANSRVDLQPSPEQLKNLMDLKISMIAANDNGTVTVYAIGGAPDSDYIMQVMITEVTSA